MKRIYPEECPICKKFNCTSLQCERCILDSKSIDIRCMNRCDCNAQDIIRHLKQQINIQKEYSNNLECMLYYYSREVHKP